VSHSFAETLGGIAVEDFLRDSWGKQFTRLPGTRGRFHDLLSWSEVNGLLQKHRLEPPRLRLVRSGEFAPKASFLRYEGGRVPFVVPEKLSQKLRDGYTLIVDAVDDMAEGVMRLAEDFERALHESVQVNMYAGWRELQGFHRHCDTHDVVILQVFGKKYWRVYEGGRPHPLKNDIASNDEKPDRILWEGVLEDGDALYIPRGVWHEASGVGEVTLHLTFGIHQRTGVTLMHWLADQLRASVDFRAPLLRFGSEDERRAQLHALREQVIASLGDDVLERYFAQHDATARSRGWASLPWSAETGATPPGARVRLAAPRALNLVRDESTVRFEANGRSWQFDAAAEPLLRVLASGPATVDELCIAASGSIDGGTVQKFVTELAHHGLVAVDGEPES
jgi:ribosomal protein L16 Arg81 hydroxylase